MRPHAHHDIELPSGPDAPRTARGALDRWLEGLVSAPAAEDIRLAATELVTNAVRHAGLGPQDTIGLTMHVLGDVVRVEVKQPTPVANVRLIAASDRSASGGYGLALVDAATDRWGVEAGPPACVWFEIGRTDGRG